MQKGEARNKIGFSFGVGILLLLGGTKLARKSWENKQYIRVQFYKDIAWTSRPEPILELIDKRTEKVSAYTPTNKELFAEDWVEVVLPSNKTKNKGRG